MVGMARRVVRGRDYMRDCCPYLGQQFFVAVIRFAEWAWSR
jgi:hypothetical protein